MASMADKSLPTSSKGFSATTEPAPTPEFLRLDPSSDRVGRFEFPNDVTGREFPNDVTGRESRVLRTSPCPPHLRRSSNNAPRPTKEERNTPSPRCSEEQGRGRTHLASTRPWEEASRRTRHASSHRRREPTGSHLPVDRVGRLELLNDVTGRELRVFRKSPCPPRSRRSALLPA
jgi:hypothetical protein